MTLLRWLLRYFIEVYKWQSSRRWRVKANQNYFPPGLFRPAFPLSIPPSFPLFPSLSLSQFPSLNSPLFLFLLFPSLFLFPLRLVLEDKSATNQRLCHCYTIVATLLACIFGPLMIAKKCWPKFLVEAYLRHLCSYLVGWVNAYIIQYRYGRVNV